MPFLPNLVVSLLDCGLCTCFLIEAINVKKERKKLLAPAASQFYP
jgi:hypothetical protein